ncbi:hypothetical protein [Vibrio diazotrophicus]|nr:hypothetical protein [Vibrio diazotrophicus]
MKQQAAKMLADTKQDNILRIRCAWGELPFNVESRINDPHFRNC